MPYLIYFTAFNTKLKKHKVSECSLDPEIWVISFQVNPLQYSILLKDTNDIENKEQIMCKIQ